MGRLDILYLDQLGNFIIQAGVPAEDPTYPPTDNVSMMVAKISVAPYTFKPETDDIRESPSIKIISKLLTLGSIVHTKRNSNHGYSIGKEVGDKEMCSFASLTPPN